LIYLLKPLIVIKIGDLSLVKKKQRSSGDDNLILVRLRFFRDLKMFKALKTLKTDFLVCAFSLIKNADLSALNKYIFIFNF